MTENIAVNTQSSIRITGKKILYFDPFEIAEELHDADVIFITHEHYDHFQPESIRKVQKDETILAAPLSMKKKVLEKSGIREENCRFFVPGEAGEILGLKVETVAAYNKLKPFHTKGKKWLGYVVTMDGTRYFVAGDTDPNRENRKVNCDVALIPVGGYYTMDAKQAADFIGCIKPKTAIPTHYGAGVGKPQDGEDFKKFLASIDPVIQAELKL
ncbi:MAG: MBL fold metallo-hydrolase [Lachnospiraceae bacterium]|nr:MBL fold metallo-hydrolase [Lachnospiraceae bacterium]